MRQEATGQVLGLVFVRTRQNTHKCCAKRNIITGILFLFIYFFNAAVFPFSLTAVLFQACPAQHVYSLTSH